MTAHILNPVTITTAMLTSSTVAENDYAAWSAATTYAAGDFVIKTSTHRIYQSSQGSNLNKDPETAGATWWVDIGPTNRWAMFDGENSTQTTGAGGFTVVFKPGMINEIYLGGVDAVSVDVSIKDMPGGTVIFSQHVDLTLRTPANWYEYFFLPFSQLSSAVILGIPPVSTSEVTLTFNSGGTAKCGIMAAGQARNIGKTLYGVRTKAVDYSYVSTDAFGRTRITKRRSSRDIAATAWLKLSEANRVEDLLSELLSVPVCVIFSEEPQHGGLRGFGLMTGEISYDYPQDCKLTINLKGLT